jgi:hypothetical protein
VSTGPIRARKAAHIVRGGGEDDGQGGDHVGWSLGVLEGVFGGTMRRVYKER